MHIHIVGIAGSMTAPLAVALKKQGHYITGTDQQKIYPPFSDLLKKAQIPLNQTVINSQIDLAIIGSSFSAFSKAKEEYEQIKSQNIPHISATKYISQHLVKANSILIAGSYGKTTITAALCHLLQKANFNPSYLFSGQGLNNKNSLDFSDSDWSVIEADESINGLDTKAKFLYYPLKYLILTSAHWEHKDSYKTERENFESFKALVIKIPKDGLLVYNSKDPSIVPLLPFAKCPTLAYSSTKLQNKLIGDFNQQNLAAVETLARYLNISSKIIESAIASFRGVKRRLEIITKINDIVFFDDYAQSGNRIKTALSAIKKNYPQAKIKVFYEPHASFLQYRSNLKELSTAFELASEVVIFQLKYNPKHKSEDRLTAKDYLDTISNSIYIPLPQDLLNHYQKSLKKGDILVHFSSGGALGAKTYQKVISLIKRSQC